MNNKDPFVDFLDKYRDNATAFCMDFTNLFYDHDGTKQMPYKKQIMFMNTKGRPPVTVVLKGRQQGFSSSIVGRFAHGAYFGQRPEYLCISRSRKQAAKILRRIRSALNSLPEPMRVEYLQETTELLTLSNGVTIYSIAPNPDTARGFSGEIAFDEFAILPNNVAHDMWTAVLPSITKGFNVNVVSTPAGKNHLFYELWTKDSLSGEKVLEQFKPWKIRSHYSEIPWQSPLIPMIKANMMPKQFAQEYEMEFLDDGNGEYFTREMILKCSNDICEEYGYINIDYKNYNEKEIDQSVKNRYNEKYKLKETFSEIYLGYDMAREQDMSIVTVFGKRHDNGNLQLIGIFNLGGAYEYQTRCVSIIAQIVDAKRVGFDVTSYGMVVKEFFDQTKIAGRMHPVLFHPTKKVPMYSNLRGLMLEGKIWMPVVDYFGQEERDAGWPEISSKILWQFIGMQYDLLTGKLAAIQSEDNRNEGYDDIPASVVCAIEAAKTKTSSARFITF